MLETKTDAKGQTITYSYDEMGRVEERSYPDATFVRFTYTKTDQRETVEDFRGVTRYGYDGRDRLTELVYPDGRKVTYTYDPAGNRTSLTAHVAGQVLTTTYTYDAANRLETVTDPNGKVTGYTYDANGNRASMAYPNGTETTYSYDVLNRLRNLTTNGPSGVMQSYQYTLGQTGNREKIDEADGTAREYTYDDVYRLAGEKVTDLSGLVYEKSFQYDNVGNRLNQTTTGQGPGTVDYAYDERDRLLTDDGHTYGWDDDGNLTSKSGEAFYFWDFENRLIRVEKTDGTVVSHAYDADGNRVRTEVTPGNGSPLVTEYLVDTSGHLSHVVVETDGENNTIAHYVRGVDDLVSVVRTSQQSFYHADGLGSVKSLTDENGNVTDRYDYSAFGEELGRIGSDPQLYQFAGEAHEPNTEFYYNRTRWLDPNMGRFLSVDKFRGIAQDPKSLHRYLYANADPANYVDPTGQFSGIALAAAMFAGSIAIIASFAFPAFKAARSQFAGDTNRFGIKFAVGGALGYVAFGGAVDIVIWEIGPARPDRRLFTVFMFGLGVGFGFTPTAGLILPSDETEFETSGNRRIEDFQGFGNITAVEVGGVGFIVAYGGMVLPDGTTIGPSLSKGPGFAVGPGVFSVLAYWRIRLLAPFSYS